MPEMTQRLRAYAKLLDAAKTRAMIATGMLVAAQAPTNSTIWARTHNPVDAIGAEHAAPA
jgi:hypothetical protein